MYQSTATRLTKIVLLTSLIGCQDPIGGAAEREPVDPLRPVSERVVGLAAAFQTTCALTADGKLHCWGENRFGEFGDGTAAAATRAVPGGGGKEYVSVHGSTGTPQMCGVDRDGVAYCWGYNLNGELGSGSAADEYSPVPVAGNIRFRTLASSYHTCGVAVDGRAYCWGSGLGGQLGTGNSTDTRVPERVASDASYTSITNGMQFSCALRADGNVDCWGWMVGLGSAESPSSTDRPTPVSGGLQFHGISAGEEHVCALTLEGAAFCWGSLSLGIQRTPLRIPGSLRFTQVASGSRMGVQGASCALTSDGEAYCWNRGLEPVRVPGDHRFAGIIGRHGGFCGYTPGGAAYCWGWEQTSSAGWVVTVPAAIPSFAASR